MPPQNLRKTGLPRERKVERHPEGAGVCNLASKFVADIPAGRGVETVDGGSESITPVYLAKKETYNYTEQRRGYIESLEGVANFRVITH